MAEILHKNGEIEMLKSRINLLETNLKKLWNDEKKIFLNDRTDNNLFSKQISPTCFYPLLSQSAYQAKSLMEKHFLNPEEIFGEWMLPSITRDDTTFKKQRYWKGAIWPPLNYLVYLGLQNYDLKSEMQILAKKSEKIFLKKWKRKNMVCENYSSITGNGNDQEQSSDSFQAWGALLGFIGLLENEKG